MEMEKISFHDAIVALAKKSGIEVVYDGNIEYQEKPEENKRDLYKELYTRVAGSFTYILNQTPQCHKQWCENQ
jgi:DNA primase